MHLKSFLFAPDAPAGGGGAPGAPAAGAPPPVASPAAPEVAPGNVPVPTAPPPAPPKPFYEGLYGADGKIDKTAWDRLPDSLKTHKDWLAKYDTIEAALIGGATAHTMAVRKALAPLPDNAPADAVAERRAHLDAINGVPKDIKGYGLEKPKDLPDMFWNQEAVGQFGKIFQEESISPRAAKRLMEAQLQITKGEIARGESMNAEFYTAQDRDFAVFAQKEGLPKEKADDLYKRGAQKLGVDPGSIIFKNATVRQMALRAAQLTSEDSLITGEAAKDGPGTELSQARDIISNPQNPLYKAFHDANDPRHDQAKDKVRALYRTAPVRSR